MSKAATKSHRWRFTRLGGFDQPLIERGADVCHLHELDPKLWAALSCPTTGLEIAPRLLRRLDLDDDGRVRIEEILTATRWACGLLKNPDRLFGPRADGLPLGEIDDGSEEGRRLLVSARRILDGRGRTDATTVTPEDTADLGGLFANSRFTGDGVITPETAGDPALAQVVSDIIACSEPVTDRAGTAGIDRAAVERFFAAAVDYLDWYAEAEADRDQLLPLGEHTEACAAVVEKVKAKIDDYFTRVRLADFDSHAAEHLNPVEADYRPLAAEALSPATEALSALPLARIESSRGLPLNEGLNPAWSSAIAALREQVIVPLLGNLKALSEAQWLDITARFAAHAAWLARQRGAAVALLGPERVRELLEGDARTGVESLIDQDEELRDTAEALESVDRLVHLYLGLDVLLNNFVNLRDFYTPDRQAVFQAGSLYLDGRSCELCVRVTSIEQHAVLAGSSNLYLAYCQCRRRGGDETMTIAAAFTTGNSRNLMVGRNGVFYDRAGLDWDATIVKLIENPISLSEAFWSPYHRLARFVGEQFEKFAASKDQAVGQKLQQDTAKAPAVAEGAKGGGFDIARFAGIFAAIGLALGALGTALASILTGLLKLPLWQLPLVVVGVVLAISGPAMLLAYLKLRSRNLAPLLDASGWAVNGNARINIPFGTTLTGTAKLPGGSRLRRHDPFAPRKTGRSILVLLLVLGAAIGFAWWHGDLEGWLDGIGVSFDAPAEQAGDQPSAAS